jgi:dimethylhistidine N-methyltransferase
MIPPIHPMSHAHAPVLSPREQFRLDVLNGLQKSPKILPPKYFYDQKGSLLFDAITQLPEYYPTRTETALMTAHAADMATLIGPRALLIEFGSGSSIKTRVLLDQLTDPAGYVPIDISTEHLSNTAALLQADYPALNIMPVAADYSQPVLLPSPPSPPARTVVYFPGSTIGNMEPTSARDFLRTIHALIAPDGALLIGVDLKKSPDILIPAYNDAAGITAAFNRNLLERINRELHADFRLGSFQHRAIWNEEASRIEMHLVSLAQAVITIAGEKISFVAGESICTEYSYKYTLESFAQLAGEAGLRVEQVWMDDEGLFSVQYVRPV